MAMLVWGALSGCSKPDVTGSAPSASAQPSQGAAAAEPPSPPGLSGPPLTDLPAGDTPVSLARAKTLVAPGSVRIELLSAGDEPRIAVRLPTSEQPAKRVELSVDVGLTITLPGQGARKQPVPPLRVAMDLAAKPIDDGRAKLTVGVAEVTLAPQTETEEAIAKQMQVLIEQLRGLEWAMTYGPRGPSTLR